MTSSDLINMIKTTDGFELMLLLVPQIKAKICLFSIINKIIWAFNDSIDLFGVNPIWIIDFEGMEKVFLMGNLN